MRIIPAIDVINGKCVRLTGGDYNRMKVYNEQPLEVAKEFEAHGIQYLHLVDLDGARSNHIVNHQVLYDIVRSTSLKVDFGGGLKSDADVRIAFESGAHQITGGSIAVHDKKTFLGWLATYGPEKIILGADARDEKVAVSGWTEDSGKELLPFILYYRNLGISRIICTDIGKDGMLNGPAFDLYRKILGNTMVNRTLVTGSGVEDRQVIGIHLIASGGISEYDQLPELAAIGCEGVIIGKAIYEERIRLEQLEEYILNN